MPSQQSPRSQATKKLRTRNNRRRQSSSNFGAFLYCTVAAFVVILFLLWISTTAVVLSNAGTNDNHNGVVRDGPGAISPADMGDLRRRHDERRANRIEQKQVQKGGGDNGAGRASAEGTASSTDQIVQYLMRLARMSSKELRAMFEPSDNSSGSNAEDPFHLSDLRKGQCPPWKAEEGAIEWLPERPPRQAAEWFKSHESHPNGPKVAVYYEHLSKAGGTSFCKLAKSNMANKYVPKYYCMPSEPRMQDARIGSWSLEKLKRYLREKTHTLMSNEWEPFQQQFLELQMSSDTDLAAGKKDDVYLMFLTTIRHPVNRLLSAYKFWGILNGPKKFKPSLETWLERNGRRASRWRVLSGDFAGNVGRFNFATWKFGGGILPVTDVQKNSETNLKPGSLINAAAALRSINDDEEVWRQSFETAIKTLTRFDLAMPMELLSDHPEPLRDILGWTNYDKIHVVNMGKVVNNDASSELDPDLYDALWEGNKLDFILYYWTCAIYLFRLNCSDSII